MAWNRLRQPLALAFGSEDPESFMLQRKEPFSQPRPGPRHRKVIPG